MVISDYIDEMHTAATLAEMDASLKDSEGLSVVVSEWGRRIKETVAKLKVEDALKKWREKAAGIIEASNRWDFSSFQWVLSQTASEEHAAEVKQLELVFAQFPQWQVTLKAFLTSPPAWASDVVRKQLTDGLEQKLGHVEKLVDEARVSAAVVILVNELHSPDVTETTLKPPLHHILKHYRVPRDQLPPTLQTKIAAVFDGAAPAAVKKAKTPEIASKNGPHDKEPDASGLPKLKKRRKQ